MVGEGYRHIWDCCCDHGFLGMSLLARQAAEHIHFVDIVPDLMCEVEANLQRFYSASSRSTWQIHCIDVSVLPLDQYEGKHLVIIAGVGGDLITQFVDNIHSQYPDLEIDFLLCPVHHQFTLRQKLNQRDFSLKDEQLVQDNQRFYEMLLVSTQPDDSNKVSLVGEGIWQSTTDEQMDVVANYLEKTRNHYRRIQQGNSKDVAHIVEAYQAVTL